MVKLSELTSLTVMGSPLSACIMKLLTTLPLIKNQTLEMNVSTYTDAPHHHTCACVDHRY